MRAMDPAGSFDNRTGEHARFTKQFQADAGADNIHNGIDGADLMEMDLLRRKTVDFSFGDGDAMKNGNGFLFDPIGKAA